MNGSNLLKFIISTALILNVHNNINNQFTRPLLAVVYHFGKSYNNDNSTEIMKKKVLSTSE